MGELNGVVQMGSSDQVLGTEQKEKLFLDFDEQPYEEDNILVRASKRRKYYVTSSSY